MKNVLLSLVVCLIMLNSSTDCLKTVFGAGLFRDKPRLEEQQRSSLAIPAKRAPNSHTNPIVRTRDIGAEGDRTFIKLFTQLRRSMLPNHAELDERLTEALSKASPNSCDIDRPKEVKWSPLDCKTQGVAFEIVEAIVNKGPKKNTVYKVYDRQADKHYAYKLFQDPEHYTAEVSFFMVADHARIVKPICVQKERKTNRPGLVLEWIEGESSRTFARKASTSTRMICRMMAQLWDVNKYLHKLGFVHGDIKADNILVRKGKLEIVLIDFGYAVPFPHEHAGRGNPDIKAPELSGLVKGRLNQAIDVWAWAMVAVGWNGSKYLPEYKGETKAQYTLLRNGHSKSPYKIGQVPRQFPLKLRQVLYLATDLNVERRKFCDPHSIALMQSLPYFEAIDWDSI